MTLETDDADRVTWLLKIERRQEGFINVGSIAFSRSGKVSFHGGEKEFVSCNAAIFVVAKLFDSTIDFRVQEESLSLFHVSAIRSGMDKWDVTSGVPIYFLVSRMPPV
jgi:hypothetical protein